MDIASFITGFITCSAGIISYIMAKKIPQFHLKYYTQAHYFVWNIFGGAIFIMFAVGISASEATATAIATAWLTGASIGLFRFAPIEVLELYDSSSARSFVTERRRPISDRMRVAAANGLTLDGENA